MRFCKLAGKRSLGYVVRDSIILALPSACQMNPARMALLTCRERWIVFLFFETYNRCFGNDDVYFVFTRHSYPIPPG